MGERVINETLRLHPPGWSISRSAINDFELIGFRVPAGANVVMSPWVMHRDPRFFPDPEEFDPGRVDVSFNAIGIPDTDVVSVPLVDLDIKQFSVAITGYITSYFLTARLAARRTVANKSGVGQDR